MNNDDNVQPNKELEHTKDSLERMKDAQDRIKELENNWKRALADYKNLEKRVAEEKQGGLAFSNLILISQLIPIFDNLQMLEKHIEDVGLKLVVKEFKQALQNEGLEEIETQGKEFDPNLMDAIETIDGEPNKVIEVLQKGYKLKDKLIRPAKVKVGKGEQPKEEK